MAAVFNTIMDFHQRIHIIFLQKKIDFNLTRTIVTKDTDSFALEIFGINFFNENIYKNV